MLVLLQYRYLLYPINLMADAKMIYALGSGDIESVPFIESLCHLFYRVGVFPLKHAFILSFKGFTPLEKNIFSCKIHY